MKQYFLVKISFAFLVFATISTAQADVLAVQPGVINRLVAAPAMEDPDRFDRLVILLYRLQETRKITPDTFIELKDDLIAAIKWDRKNLDSLSENLQALLNAPIAVLCEPNESLEPIEQSDNFGSAQAPE